MVSQVKENKSGALQTLAFGVSSDHVMESIVRDGGVILEGVFTPEQVNQVNAELDGAIERHRVGSDIEDELFRDFFGERTKRMTGVVSLSKTFMECFISNPTTQDYIKSIFKGVCETFWLNTAQVIEIHPGETVQPLHRDMYNYPVFAQYGPHAPEVMANMIVALVDITEEAGATRVIPGSHKWDFDREFDQSMTVPVEMKAGSVFFFSGKVVHGGGANTSKDIKRRAISTAFNPGFLVPEEAYPFSVPLEQVRNMTPEVQQMLGFRSFHQNDPVGGSLWQLHYGELAEHLNL
jgi:ectoine hydroxylase-related dioxygenase (phytanoyl-CoA dioxygenase family)